MQQRILFVIVCMTVHQSLGATLPEDPFYIAGVVEFLAAQLPSQQRLQDNLKGYLNIIASDEAEPTDIIVFPELTLNDNETPSYVPDPKIEIISPCSASPNAHSYHEFLVQLSCAAKNTSKYVVVNIVEKEKCLPHELDPRPCAANGHNLFNTNVVFDRSGAIISRYRKIHLYYEPRNTTLVAESVAFETDFGVKFGLFTCFDIMFYYPAVDMVQNQGITDFIFPTMWFSQLPFLTAVQTQLAWAYANDVNFLGAGSSHPQVGSTGSSIISGKTGILTGIMKMGEGERQLYVAKVPKKQMQGKLSQRLNASKQSVHSNYSEVFATNSRLVTQNDFEIKQDELRHYETIVIDLNTKHNSLKRRLCYKQAAFCCNFELNWQYISSSSNGSSYYTYRLAVLDGYRREGERVENRLRNCALLACIGNDIMDCGKVFPSQVAHNVQPQVSFKRVVIEAAFPHAERYIVMPNSVKDDMMPLDVNQFEWSVLEDKDYQHVRYVLNTTTDNLLTFSIYGNYFGAASSVKTNAIFSLPLCFTLLLFLVNI